jgi:glycosyltransferase involved in cell wall biosynthesis
MIEPNMPLVSVVIPFFNAEIYLKETIESVLNQDYTDWELILIDDGSSDGSTSIAKEYAEKYLHKIF